MIIGGDGISEGLPVDVSTVFTIDQVLACSIGVFGPFGYSYDCHCKRLFLIAGFPKILTGETLPRR